MAAHQNMTPEQWLRAFFATDATAMWDYSRAQLDYPHLTKVSTLPDIVGHVEGVVNHFQEFGLSRNDYLAAVASQPQLLLHKSAQVIERVERVLSHFSADPITRCAYLCALTDYPELFRAEPSALIATIELIQQGNRESGALDKRVGAFARRVGELLPSRSDVHRITVGESTPTTLVIQPVVSAIKRILSGRAA